MSRKRKDALGILVGLAAQVERHVSRVLSSLGHSSRNKWRGESLGWLLQMEDLLPHVGKKTAAEWQTRIDGWRSAIEGTQNGE
jgi:hypothetical protein